ncbi:MAG: hypothetical protein Alpg2KO_05520 [Alphaproteobacteria bacterium]
MTRRPLDHLLDGFTVTHRPPVARRDRPVVGERLNIETSYGTWRRIELSDSGEAILKGMYRNDRTLLQRAVTRKLDLSGIDLTARSLAKADLEGGKLARARLDRADITEASLFYCVLEGASLERVEAMDASFQGTYLKNAILRRADLRNASFEGACITGTDFRGADLTGAVFSVKADFASARFDGATGLDQVMIVDEDHEPVEGARLTEMGLELPSNMAMLNPDAAPGNLVQRWLRKSRIRSVQGLDYLRRKVMGRRADDDVPADPKRGKTPKPDRKPKIKKQRRIRPPRL